MEIITRKSWYVDVNAFLPWEDVDFDTQTQITAAAMHPHVGGNVDEAPGAYKDIGEVIARQGELLDVVTRLRPVITLKGDSRAKED